MLNENKTVYYLYITFWLKETAIILLIHHIFYVHVYVIFCLHVCIC